MVHYAGEGGADSEFFSTVRDCVAHRGDSQLASTNQAYRLANRVCPVFQTWYVQLVMRQFPTNPVAPPAATSVLHST